MANLDTSGLPPSNRRARPAGLDWASLGDVSGSDPSGMRGGIRARTFLAAGVLAVLIGITFAVLLVSIRDLDRSADLEMHSQEVLVSANRAERLVVDLETGLRGFVITGQDRFLQPWHDARAALPEQMSRLRRLVADNPEQESRTDGIERAATSLIEDYSPRVLDAVRRKAPSTGLTVLMAEGKRRVDAMRSEFDSFVAEERRLSSIRHQASESAARTAVVAAAAGIAGSVVLVLAFSSYLARVIVRPIRAMAAAASRIASGDLSARTTETGVAEIGLLGESFNAMAASVEESQGELARIAEEQSALRRMATLVAQGVRPQDVFAAVTEEVGRLLRADLAHMVRIEGDQTVSGIAGWSRDGDSIPVGPHVPLEGESVTASVLKTGRPSRMSSYATASGAIAGSLRAMGVRSSVGSPVIVDGRLWGVVIVSSKGSPLAAEAESRLSAFTGLVATAISNAHASTELAASRARIVAAADDARRRIERDLHDGVQQRIVSLGLELRTTEFAVPPELPELQKQVSRVADELEALLDELREISRGIHPAILSEGGLGPALRALGRRSSIPIDVNVPTTRRYPEPVEVTVYYVASEALANAVKHADASATTLVLEENEDVLRLIVRDDGVGGADPGRGSGLAGLKDRVEALGGAIAVSSPVGEGTSLTAELPIAVNPRVVNR